MWIDQNLNSSITSVRLHTCNTMASESVMHWTCLWTSEFVLLWTYELAKIKNEPIFFGITRQIYHIAYVGLMLLMCNVGFCKPKPELGHFITEI